MTLRPFALAAGAVALGNVSTILFCSRGLDLELRFQVLLHPSFGGVDLKLRSQTLLQVAPEASTSSSWHSFTRHLCVVPRQYYGHRFLTHGYARNIYHFQWYGSSLTILPLAKAKGTDQYCPEHWQREMTNTALSTGKGTR